MRLRPLDVRFEGRYVHWKFEVEGRVVYGMTTRGGVLLDAKDDNCGRIPRSIGDSIAEYARVHAMRARWAAK